MTKKRKTKDLICDLYYEGYPTQISTLVGWGSVS